MTNKEENIENILKNIPNNWKQKVEQYELIINGIKDGCSVSLFDYDMELLKRMVDECNAFALEKALEVILTYIKISNIGKKNFVPELSIFVDKCFKSSRLQTRNFGNEIFVTMSDKFLSDVYECLLMFIGDNKPTVVNGVIETLIQIIKKYKIIPIKKLLQNIPKLFESRDKQTRTLTKSLTLSIAAAYGKNTIDALLKELKPIHYNEINSELESVTVTQAVASGKVCNEEESSNNDHHMNLPLVDLSTVLVPALFQQLDGTRQERKEALNNLYSKIENKRLSNGNFRELILKLCQIVTKDSQINSVQIALCILTNIAKFSGKSFANSSLNVIEACLEKFKEKKPSVLNLTRDCIDAAYSTTTFDQCLVTLTEFLENKNPSIRLEVVSFILRISANKRTNDAIKKHVKSLLPVLRHLCDDGVFDIRDQTFQLIGRLCSQNNQKMIDECLKGLDGVKIQRIKTFVTKEDLTIVSTVLPNIGMLKVTKHTEAKKISKNSELKNVDVLKKNIMPVIKIQKEYMLSTSILEDKYIEIFGLDNVKKMTNPVWQNRLAVLDFVMEYVRKTELDKIGCQIVIRFMLVKPALKESNIAVLKKKIEVIQMVLRDNNASAMVAEICVQEIVEKFGDIKVGTMSKVTLEIIFGIIPDISQVAVSSIQAAIDSKSVKCMGELIDWLTVYLNSHETRNFVPKDVIPLIKQLLSYSNQTLKQSSILLIAAMYKRSGRYVVDAFETEKSGIKEMIEKEVSKINVLKKDEKIAVLQKQKVIEAMKPQLQHIPIESREEEIEDSNVLYCSNSSVHERGSDFKDDARSFVLDLCQNLNVYIDKYSSSTLEKELGEIFSSIMTMGDDRMQRSLILLNSSLMRKTTTVQSMFTQTDIISNSQEKLLINATKPISKNSQSNFITLRRGKRSNKENRESEHVPFTIHDDKPQIFGERGNIPDTQLDKPTIISREIDILRNSINQSVINDTLCRIIEVVKTGGPNLREHLSVLVIAIISRLSKVTLEKNKDGEQGRTQEIEKIISILSMIFVQHEHCCEISDDVTSHMLHLLFSLINNVKGQYYNISNDIHKSLNYLIMQVVENLNISKVLYCLLSLLDQCFDNGTYKNSFCTMIVKLIWNRTKIIKDKPLCDDYLVKLLKVLNDQFCKYLSSDDVVNSLAFKSVKTLIDSLTKLKGLHLLTYIPEYNNDNLKKYIHHCHDRANKA